MSYLSLRKPVITPVKTKVLGQTVHIRRLSSDEQTNYTDVVNAQDRSGLSNRDIAILGVKLVLGALVNPDGSAPSKKELPEPEDILAVHSNGDILEAISAVQRHAWGTLEAVEDAVKN